MTRSATGGLMENLIAPLFWFALALIFACLEIEAEGKYGWAEKMPTWYRTTGLIPKLYGLAMDGKPLTGYHAFMFILPIMVFHVPFVSGVEWTLAAEIMTWAMYFLWCPLWDYLWFVLNPHYGFKNFRRRNVWWHAKGKWLADLMPIGHLIAWGVSLLLAWGTSIFLQDDNGAELTKYLVTMFIFCILTVATIIFSPLYHNWYRNMREKDDRDQVSIKHRLPENTWQDD